MEARREPKTVAQIARAFACQPRQVAKGKKEAVDGRAAFLAMPRGERSGDRLIPSRYELIGRLKMAVHGCKKQFERPYHRRVSWVEREGMLSVTRPCER